MPKRTDINSILIIGAGPIVIGQACEFDYSGTQACKALKEEGYRVILINSNPATIMTDPDVADATYIEPITPEFIEKIIIKEKPDAILPTMGGQTALNTTLKLFKQGILEKHNVKLIGAQVDAIEKAEDRELFNIAMAKIGLEVPKNMIARSWEDAQKALKTIGLPAIIRPSFTLGGGGGGVATTEEEFEKIVRNGLNESPVSQVLIDESLLGWKEFEMEVVRDKADNCIIICSIENVDPMGVHTGDSITVAPALTLTDKEYQRMRDASCAVLREIGIETGGSNVQFGINPKNGRMVVIEMNPRVSRSSALASKATGFPIAKIATKLAVGYTLDELLNDVTKVTPASFEPTIDYVVTKIPRFTFEKFGNEDGILSSTMKSVGETMAIGGNFCESLQKALRSLETGLTGLNDKEDKDLKTELQKRTPKRILLIAQALRENYSIEEVNKLTDWDPWFLGQIKKITDTENDLKSGKINLKDKAKLLELKKLGFSDKRIAELTKTKELDVRNIRHELEIRPVYKRVDTCAAEFESFTPYMYSTYRENSFELKKGKLVEIRNCESNVSKNNKVIILGSGPNRIGQGIEFDYTCVHACFAMKEQGIESIMVNCNPETVSTDYDTSDRLYFEPLTAEDVTEIYYNEASKGKVLGINVQFGGQTPLKLAKPLEEANIPLLGTSNATIELAEDRKQFKDFIESKNLKQPKSDICDDANNLFNKAEVVGYPLVCRPSFVLGGRAMAIINNRTEMENYMREFADVFETGPLLLDSFLTNAIEVDVDAICDGKDVLIAGIMEHIEQAGIHSGDSACSIPPYSLPKNIIEELKKQTEVIALGLNVKGLINIQYAIKGNDIYILEVNPRASRTVPFVAKATGVKVAKIASLVMLGEKLSKVTDLKKTREKIENLKHFAVKEVVFPFNKFTTADVLLGPEMKSTGEGMGIDKNFSIAYAKAQMSCHSTVPLKGSVFISVKDSDKKDMVEIAQNLEELGFKIYSTSGTAAFLKSNGINVEKINKVLEGSPHIVDLIVDGKIDLIINTTEGKKSIEDSFSIRRTALVKKLPYTTTATGARELVRGIKEIRSGTEVSVKPIQAYG
ncbi:MAG TPA: carbamoyl phosphate synthase large subunit [Alphaproteobacteria bacterium]|nr:carbamoyl phosphate synthase large subunit [Alphaproteobacteria bacterium]